MTPRRCEAVIDNGAALSGAWEGRGFGRRYVNLYRCKSCGAEYKMRVTGRLGKRPNMPPGAFVCGALL